MARRKPPPAPPRKRRTREHVLGDLGVNHVQRHVLLAGHTLQVVSHDYGIDSLLFTSDNSGEAELGAVRVQVKAHERMPVRPRTATVAQRVERADVLSWLLEEYPVILAAYDANADRAYWLYVQAHFAARAGFSRFSLPQFVTLPIPVANVLDAAAVQRFRVFRDRVRAQFPGEIEHRE